MKKFITLVLIAISITGFTNSTKAQGKIGYISADEVMVSMPEAAKIDTQLNQFQQALYQAAQDRKTAFDEAVAKFYTDSAKMTASVKEVKRGELQQQVTQLGGAEQQIQQQMQQKQQELLGPVQKRLLNAINEVAKENGYAYILTREALLVMPPGDDIGNLVKRKLGVSITAPRNTTAPKTNTTAPKTTSGAKK